MKVCYVFSLESPHDSNEYTQYTIFNIKQENNPKLSQFCSYGIFFQRLKNEFEKAIVQELSVFEPLKFYCMPLCKNALTQVPQGFNMDNHLLDFHTDDPDM